MEIWHLLVFLAIGAVAGWLAGMFVKGSGFGLLGDVVVGVVGAILGGWLFGMAGVSLPIHALAAQIVVATIGAIVLLFLIRLVKRA